jgi:hypothetical protein
MENETSTQFEKLYDTSPSFFLLVSGHKKLSISFFPGVGWGFILWIRQHIDEGGFGVYQAITSECRENWTASEAMTAGLDCMKSLR